MKCFLKIVFFLFLFPNSTFLVAQNSDCDDMKILTDSVYFPRNISGYGNKLEFSKNNSYNKNTFENETNSKWYLITMQDSGVFTFDIKTLNISNDWDFILYRYTDNFVTNFNTIHDIHTISYCTKVCVLAA